MIASFGMALRYSFGLGQWADKMDQAIAAVLAKGIRTRDIAGSAAANASTKQMGAAILAELKALA
jgi:3-isopropylmalate dehydrogenase